MPTLDSTELILLTEEFSQFPTLIITPFFSTNAPILPFLLLLFERFVVFRYRVVD